jgi:Helix-hairpin-helix motif
MQYGYYLMIVVINKGALLGMGCDREIFITLSGCMRFLKFLSVFLAAIALSVVVACSSQTSAPLSSSTTAPAPGTMAHGGMAHGKKININTAILSELDKFESQLGVPALSNKIQASRPYGKPEELVAKKVINQAQFDQIKEMVTIEEIVLTGEAKDLDYMVKLGLMKGHMMVAKELLDLGKPNQAEPHIGHPVEEIYADVEEQLNERKVKEFKSVLISLQDLVKAGAKDKAKIEADFKASVMAIDGAIAVLPDSQRSNPKFVLQVINGLLDTANSEYGAAISDGKIREAIEYQDSRGFVIYAGELYGKIAAKVKPESNSKITADMKTLASAWPSALPPSTPVKTTAAVTQLIKGIEAAGSGM